MLVGRGGPRAGPQVRAIYSPGTDRLKRCARPEVALVDKTRRCHQLFARSNRRADHRPRKRARAAISRPEKSEEAARARLSGSGRDRGTPACADHRIDRQRDMSERECSLRRWNLNFSSCGVIVPVW